MGQKINPVGLRLKTRLNWNSVYSTHDFKNYAKITMKTKQIHMSTKIICLAYNLITNNTFVHYNGKIPILSTKLLQMRNIFNNPNTNTLQSQTRNFLNRNNAQNSVKLLTVPTKWTFFNFTNLFNSVAFKKILNRKLHNNFIVAKLITTCIRILIQTSSKLKIVPNLNVEIPLILINLLKPIKGSLLGIKVTISGKWKKTRSGRKQKLCIKYGKINSATLSNVVLFDYITEKTKFGAVSVKVWISQHKNVSK